MQYGTGFTTNGRQRPLEIARLTPSVNESTSPGAIFVAPFGDGDAYLEILNDSGRVLYSQKRLTPALGFRMQPAGGYSFFDVPANGYIILNSAFDPVDTFRCIGYQTDAHEFLMQANGNVLLLGIDTARFNDVGSAVPKDSAVLVQGVVIQEQDSHHRVVFQWRGWDPNNFRPSDMQHLETATSEPVDAIHANGLAVDSSGDIYLSSRHLSEITKIDRKTGEIVWRLGGKRNQFIFINDSLGFSYQHSPEILPNNHILLFGNGNYHNPPFSRAVEYALDEEAKTATLVWQFDYNRTQFSSAMGSVMRLPNGNTYIGWGANFGQSVTEVTKDGKIVYDAAFPIGWFSYRAFRLPWRNEEASVDPIKHNPSLVLRVSSSADGVIVRVVMPAESTATISVMDEIGRCLFQRVIDNLPAGASIIRLPLAQLPTGAYHAVLRTRTGVTVSHFIH